MARIPTLTRWVAIVVTLAAAPLAAQQAGPTLEDLFRMEALGDLEMSPDGSRALYTVRTADLAENETDTDIWLVATDGGEALRMTRSSKPDTRPRWAPDGSTFAFLSSRTQEDDEESRTAIYRMSPAGGEPERLYSHATAISSFVWSPDGRWIAFTARDETAKEAEERDELGRDVEIEDAAGDFSHLWVLDVASGEARRLSEGREWTIRSFAWAPDSRRIVYSGTPTPLITDSFRGELWVVDATASGAAPRRVTRTAGQESDPVWSPDGEWIVYQGNVSPNGYRIGYGRSYRVRPDGGQPEDISPRQDLDASTYVFTPGGDAVFFEAGTGTTSGIFYMPLATREAVRLTPEDGVYGNASFSRDRRRVAFTHETPQQPAEVFTAAIAAPRAQALATATRLTTHNAELAALAVGRTEVLRWKSVDGREIEGVVVYPAGFSQGSGAHALVVKIHGGPAGVFTQNFQAGSYGNNAQLFAADGYVMLMPNPRGSTNYGDEGQRAVMEDWGGLDFRDIMVGVDTLIERGVAHPDSLGVMGWSYGGYMTAWTITQTNRFRAAVVGAGITEPVAMWGTQDVIHTFEGYFGGADPWAEGLWEVYQKSSPLAFVRNVKTPTLIIHGRNDPRVPPNQGQIFFRALRALEVPTALVWLPRTPHGPSEPGLQYETARMQKAWMDHWIRGEPLTGPLEPFVTRATEQR